MKHFFFSVCIKDVWWAFKGLMRISYLRCLSSLACAELLVATLQCSAQKTVFWCFWKVKVFRFQSVQKFQKVSFSHLGFPIAFWFHLFPGDSLNFFLIFIAQNTSNFFMVFPQSWMKCSSTSLPNFLLIPKLLLEKDNSLTSYELNFRSLQISFPFKVLL